MELIFLVLAFIFGTIVGSFLNVVIFRYNTGRDLGGRSVCLSCGKKLSSLELIPLLSFLIQKGSCLSCGSKISSQYPLVETLTGLIFAGVIYKFLPLISGGIPTPSLFIIGYWLLSFSILIAITGYDLKHKIIPDGLVLFFVVLSFCKAFYFPTDAGFISDISAGVALALPFFIIWFFSKGKAMGLGDGKLAFGLGWMLGLSSGFASLLISFWIGGLTGLYLLSRGGFSMKSELPFAPFMVLGAFLAFFFGIDFWVIANFFA